MDLCWEGKFRNDASHLGSCAYEESVQVPVLRELTTLDVTYFHNIVYTRASINTGTKAL